MESMPLAHLLATYADGDEHGWDVEFDYLREIHADLLAGLAASIRDHGITRPIDLGRDGRIWDGHHRLCVAHDLGLTHVPVRHA